MEGLLRFSKFKLHLLALISNNHDLRERERSAREELRISAQGRREAEADFAGKLGELRAELASRDELQRKLEARIKYLENDNILLEKKQKELKDTLDNVLKSRDSFMNIYKDSTCVLRSAIEVRDRKLSMLSEKIQKHLSLFDSIEKEAKAIKQMMDRVQELVSGREQIVTRLKEKMDKLSTFDEEFMEKICSMESKLRNVQHELRRKDTALLELKEQLEEAKNNIFLQSQVEEGLHRELLGMELILRKIQDTVMVMCAQPDPNAKSLTLEGQAIKMASGDGRSGEMRQVVGEDSTSNPPKDTNTEDPVVMLHPEDRSVIDTSDRNVNSSCTSELHVHSSPQSECCGPPSVVNIFDASADGNKYLDSESSTTEAEPTAGPWELLI